MSWSASGKITRRADGQTSEDFPDPQFQSGAGEAESKAAYDAASDAAAGIVESGALGSGDFVIEMNGHSNAEHKQTGNLAADHLNISIRQVPPAQAVQPETVEADISQAPPAQAQQQQQQQ